MRVILSFRAIGEGHISSLTFRSGVLDGNNNLIMRPVSPFVETAAVALNPTYEKRTFIMVLEDSLEHNEMTKQILDKLPDVFQFDALKREVQELSYQRHLSSQHMEAIEMIFWIARSNFVKDFSQITAGLALENDGGTEEFQVEVRNTFTQAAERFFQRNTQVLFLEDATEFNADRCTHFLRDRVEAGSQTLAGTQRSGKHLQCVGKLDSKSLQSPTSPKN